MKEKNPILAPLADNVAQRNVCHVLCPGLSCGLKRLLLLRIPLHVYLDSLNLLILSK